MNTAYTDIDIHFSMDGIPVQALNILYERFLRAVPSHSHGSGCYEIHCIPYGYGMLMAQGRRYDISPGTLFVTGPHIEHAQTPTPSDPMQEYCVYLKIRDSSRRKKVSPVMDAFTAMPFWIGKDTQGVLGILRQLFDELELRRIGYQNQVGLLLSQLLIAMVRSYEQRQPVRTALSKASLTDWKSVIIEEYFLYEYKSLSLSGLADRLKLSPRQTQRLLMESYGKSFQEKKADARMSAAAILLADMDQSITSIAEALGYSSPEHFSSTFRKYYGVSPRTYRQNIPRTSPPMPL